MSKIILMQPPIIPQPFLGATAERKRREKFPTIARRAILLSMSQERTIKGRGAAGNPTNRFEAISFEREEDWNPAEDRPLRTQFFRDATSSLITYNKSPDVGFEASINPYRGCEHGCIYCYARPTHEFLGFSAGLDFESKIMVKENAPELLRNELSSRKWKPQTLAMSGVTDCYQPIEKKLRITRGCLEVLAEFRNPVAIISKNYLVTRDIDVLSEMAKHECVMVNLSVTTLDASLTPVLEPRSSLPEFRLRAIRELTAAGIPVGVMIAPIIPGLTDHEIPSIVNAVAKAGAVSIGYVVLRLPYAVKDLFESWIERHFPERKDKVLNRIRAMRGGKLNDSNFHSRMEGEGIFAQQIEKMFDVAVRKAGLAGNERPELSTKGFMRPAGPQLELTLGPNEK
jgi:DNA repair photolyase